MLRFDPEQALLQRGGHGKDEGESLRPHYDNHYDSNLSTYIYIYIYVNI